MRQLTWILLWIALAAPAEAARLKDLAAIEGVRENQLLGYGLVVGLSGTGDRQQTIFSTQSLSNLLRNMGVNVAPTALRVRNVAAVMVTASLPAFARPGAKLDVTVSSIGDANSLRGGSLLLTALKGANGEAYATAQGPLSIGGLSAGGPGANVSVNHPTVGRIPEGGLVERPAPSVPPAAEGFRLTLRRADFVTAARVQAALEKSFPDAEVRAEDAGSLWIRMPEQYRQRPVDFMARLDAVEVEADRRARVALNERTGTVVIGGDVRIAPVAVLHGSLTVQVTTDLIVSQPGPLSPGTTTTVPQTTVQVSEEAARTATLPAGATVEEAHPGADRDRLDAARHHRHHAEHCRRRRSGSRAGGDLNGRLEPLRRTRRGDFRAAAQAARERRGSRRAVRGAADQAVAFGGASRRGCAGPGARLDGRRVLGLRRDHPLRSAGPHGRARVGAFSARRATVRAETRR